VKLRQLGWWIAFGAAWVATGCASPPPAGGSADATAPWTEWTLPGKRPTWYRHGVEDGRRVVVAEAAGSASMLRRKLRHDAGALRRVRFAWRVDQLVEGADLRDRESADAPVRVAFAFDGDHARLPVAERMRFELASALTGEAPPFAMLMYVWDNEAPLESVIPGGRSNRIRKIVVDRGAAHLGQWRVHERDVVADFRRAFGEEPGPLIGIALMTDADNTGARARAAYGEVELIGPGGDPL
jgi:hypothetical protein